MGTVLEFALVTADASAARATMDAAFREVDELDALLARRNPESQIAALNRASGGEPLAVDPRVYALVERAVRVAEVTDGSFDVTIGPLVALWIEAARANRLPEEAALRAAREFVDARRIELAEGAIRLPAGNMSLDLGGIAKGYALDRVAALLRSRGVDNALLSFGQSSGWALGSPPDRQGWRLLLRGPAGGFLGVVTLRDQAFSVSSSLGQWSEIEGRRLGHIIDPRSGWPITRGREAAVVSDDAALAEGLSTALTILEPADGIALIDRLPRAEALIADEDGSLHESRAWSQSTLYQPLPAN